MGLKFVDGMDSYASNADFVKKWNENPSPGDTEWLPTGGRFGGGAIKLTPTQGQLLKVVPEHQTLIFGWSLKVSEFGTDERFIARTAYAGDAQVGVLVNPDGTLQVIRSDSPNKKWDFGFVTLKGATSKALHAGSWHFIEVRIKHSETVGEVQVWVDEEKWVDLTGVDTVGEDVNVEKANDITIGFVSVGSGGYQIIDDFYAITPDGVGQNNSRLGDIRIETLLPSADTTQADFTPKSGGNNYEEVDEEDLDGDTTYNSSDTQGDRDLFQFEDIADTPDQIFALVASIAARKETAGTRRLTSVLNSNGVIETGGINEADRVLTQDYLYHQFINPLNPDGDVDWTKAAVDAVEAGYEITE